MGNLLASHPPITNTQKELSIFVTAKLLGLSVSYYCLVLHLAICIPVVTFKAHIMSFPLLPEQTSSLRALVQLLLSAGNPIPASWTNFTTSSDPFVLINGR